MAGMEKKEARLLPPQLFLNWAMIYPRTQSFREDIWPPSCRIETPQYAFADFAEFNARLRNKEIAPGGIVAAGSNFGCGSSREQAASTLKGHGLVIIARGYGRIFLQNAVNLGLKILVCPMLEAREGDELKITSNQVLNMTTNQGYDLQPLPAARRAIIDAGGLIPYTRERLLKMHALNSRTQKL